MHHVTYVPTRIPSALGVACIHIHIDTTTADFSLIAQAAAAAADFQMTAAACVDFSPATVGIPTCFPCRRVRNGVLCVCIAETLLIS